MSAPQQLFDGSFFEAVFNTPEGNITPPEATAEATAEAGEQREDEIENFDWDAYNLAFYESAPQHTKRTEEGRAMGQVAASQIWIARRLSPDVVAFLLQNIPARALWTFINGERRAELLHKATRGFQRTPQIVRQPIVRTRILQWIEKNPAENYLLVMLWANGDALPPVALAVQAMSDDDLERQMPALLKKFGLEATTAALAFAARPKAFLALGKLRGDAGELQRLVEDAEDVPESPCEVELAPEVGELTPAPNSDAARYWKEQFEASEETRRQLCESLEKTLDASHKNRAALGERNAQVEVLKKREKIALVQAHKKLENVEQRLGHELSELHKNFERQNRKLRALEREKIEMDNENRRFKKQLRHTAQLLEEERKKIAVLERSQPQIEVAPAPIDSIMTPAASQSAPNRPVVVQPPTPLDEIFEWRAEGRMVKITPRAVRRLIDQNDEDAVFSIMQALESLKIADRSTHGKFLKRLGDSGAYYPRVLTESMARVLVDASNVARHTPNRYGKGQLRHLLEMRDELRRLDCFPILFYADASLRYFIDEANKFRDMVAHGEIIVADKGTEADEILAREARRTGAYVLTNDAKFFHKVSPDFEPPRVSFRIYDGTVIVDDF